MRRLFGSAAAFLILLAGWFVLDGSAPTAALQTPDIRGVTLDARARPSDDELQRLADLGATHLFVIPFGWQQSADDPSISLRPNNARWYSEDDAGIRDLDRRADSLGMSVVVKPHVWIRGAAASGIDFESDEEWAVWERNYRALALHYARLSADIDAPLFVIGTELAGPALERPAFWRELVTDIRSEYPGRLTYAANWWEEYEHVAFWDALDYVGVQAYFPLDSVDVHGAWTDHLEQLEQTAARTDLPVLFTEIGYRSVGYAAAEPWRWPERSETEEPRPDLQAELYAAFFERIWHRPWFAGAVVWKWRPGPADEGRQDRDALDFTVRDKPAERIIADWYTRE